jgi:hypothetical protein
MGLCKPAYGAALERGQVETATETGCTVRSFDRPGLITPEIPAMGDDTYAAGDNVLFFLFPDGTGVILCGA